MTRGTCELLVDNKDLESTNGEIVGRACGGASVDAFVHLSPLFCLWTFVHFHILVQNYLALLCQQKVIMSLHLLSK